MNGVRRLFTNNSSGLGNSTTTTTQITTETFVNVNNGTTVWTPIIVGGQTSDRSTEQPGMNPFTGPQEWTEQLESSPFHSLRSTESADLMLSSGALDSRPGTLNSAPRNGGSINGLKAPSKIRISRRDLILDLLASESAIECKDFQKLESNELAALKKEQAVLSSRQDAVTKKLKVESRIRDATRSFERARTRDLGTAQSDADSTYDRVDAMQRDLLQLKEQSFDISRRLLEHHCSVLSFKVREVHKPVVYDVTRKLSFSRSANSDNQRKITGKFGPAHLYANHSEAVVPRSAKAAEEHLQQLSDEVELLKRQHADKVREFKSLEVKKLEDESVLQAQLGNASEELCILRRDVGRAAGLQGQVDELMEERENWEDEKQNLRNLLGEERQRIAEMQTELDGWKASNTQILLKQKEWESERAELNARIGRNNRRWEEERQMVESQINKQAERLDKELTLRRREWNEISDVLRSSAEMHQIEVEDGSSLAVAKALSSRLSSIASEVEMLRQTRGYMELSSRLNGKRSMSVDDDAVEFQLRSLWSILPSPEARALKLGGRNKVTSSPVINSSSLSELDVRALKALYDKKGGSRTITPAGDFSIEAFIQRVQALVADDRALIERLIRFAQGHELLRTNAERAQKLAKESSQALEIYQKQVKALQDKSDSSDGMHESLIAQLAEANRTIEGLKGEKKELETRTAKQIVQLASLTTANEALSAKTVALTAEPELARKYMENQISELQQSLNKAEEEIENMRNSEAAQQLQKATLLDELNTMQTDNAKLREQLRVEQRKQK